MHKPDYAGQGIVNLMASLQLGLGNERPVHCAATLLEESEVRDARNVVLVVIDGLGYEYLCAHPQASALNGALRGKLTSVFPSTTASAITTYLTGDAPQQHAITGWHMYMREMGAIMTMLPGFARFGGESLVRQGIDLPKLLGNRSFNERITADSHMVLPMMIADSAYTLAHRGPGQVSAYETLNQMFDEARSIVTSQDGQYVHAYWPNLDATGHRFGMASPRALEVLMELDRSFARFVEDVKGTGTLVVLCADHGQVDTKAQDWVSLDADTAAGRHLSVPLCGEPRAAYCYVNARNTQSFGDAIAAEFGSADVLHESDQWLRDGWYGLGEPHPELLSRTGDFVLMPGAHQAAKDWLPLERRYQVVGVHGGATASEMFVPLIVVST
ncbi:MAG: phosphodiesterase [Chromatiales bacterium]|nr:phosphodiesterase [Chromatiales bacterium]